jgi:glyoxylate/hydroxypyruvate reductase A
MHITFFSKDTKPEPWVSALRQQLPEARVEAWAAGADPADYAVVWAPPQEFLDAQPRLKGLFNIGAGVDALMQLRLPTGVPVVRLDDAGMSVQMAEYVCHAVIRYFRELDVYAEEAQQAHWAFRRPRVRADFTVGVMGLGVLGQRVAQALRGFEFPVVGWSRTPREVEGITCHAVAEGLSAFLGASQVLVNLLPLTPDTENILNRDTLAQLRTGAYVINVARGAHVVDADLLALLDSGHLAGATLDVFRTEPLPAEHPFWQHRRITVTPHTSARTLRDESVAQIVGKIRALERGEPITGVVDPLRGY